MVKRGAEALLPLFEASGGALGHISGQVDMQQMRNEAAMKEMAEALAALSPNVMVKIPGSTQGMPVFRHLASKGIATNATCVFTISQVMTVAQDGGRGAGAGTSRTNARPRRAGARSAPTCWAGSRTRRRSAA